MAKTSEISLGERPKYLKYSIIWRPLARRPASITVILSSNTINAEDPPVGSWCRFAVICLALRVSSFKLLYPMGLEWEFPQNTN